MFNRIFLVKISKHLSHGKYLFNVVQRRKCAFYTLIYTVPFLSVDLHVGKSSFLNTVQCNILI